MNVQATGVDKALYRKACRSLGLAVRRHRPEQVTHLVTALAPRRTLKLLHAIACGAWVVSERWLTDSAVAGRPLPPEPYEAHEAVPGCRTSRLRAERGMPGVLAGLEVMVGGATGIPGPELTTLLASAGAVCRPAADVSERFEVRSGGRSLAWTEADLLDAIEAAQRPQEAAAPAREAAQAAQAREAAQAAPAREAALAAQAQEAASNDVQQGSATPQEAPAAKRPRHGDGGGKENDAAAARGEARPNERACEAMRDRGGQRRARRAAASAAGAGRSGESGGEVVRLASGEDVVFVERGGGGGGGGGGAAAHWLREDALALFRRRLPRCNVDVVVGDGAARRDDFLGGVAERGAMAVLRQGETTLAACAYATHRSAAFCEVTLMATAARHARRGLGSALLGALEARLRAAGVRHVAACAGLDCTPFWAKRGFSAEACLPPRAWALLLDGFSNSRVMSKELD